MEIREEFLWGYAEKLEEDAATALAYAMEELENSKNPEIHVYVADALMALDDYEGAVEEINEALEKNIVNVNYAKSLKGEALFYLERYEESKTIFTEIKARANIPHNPELSGLFLKGGLEKCC